MTNPDAFDSDALLFAEPELKGHKARKRFGQNFLHDQRVIGRIVQAVAPRIGDNLVEIGPGMGALTGPLLQAADHLTVLELDRDLAASLPARMNHLQHLTIVEGDALRFDFAALIDPVRPLRVVGNLPYNISTPLLFHLIRYGAAVKDMTFMLQKEVVDRIVATPTSKDFGRLSVMIQYFCKPTFLFEVPPGAFNPPPKVTSAVFRLEPYAVKPIQARNEKLLAALVSQVFNQRRKTLRNTLKGQVDEAGFASLGINPMARPETLAIADFVAIADYVDLHGGAKVLIEDAPEIDNGEDA
jgi:16S rRNA (adenine1518-N6/adenine1519-N6)-dimethyltransferase